ncbi:MAG: hypothetical protein AMS18_01770 [Gemmatimonas sp. SG8_17]|nr:MAG: hypothetical protein AMS18_01770 [Gemmatimonas sp. SG8_17]
MTEIAGIGARSATVPRDEQAQLRRMAHELEGVFLNQLFQAMRATIPEGGVIAASSGQDMFQAMLDEQLATAAAERWRSGLGEALCRQLSRHLAATAQVEPEGAS